VNQGNNNRHNFTRMLANAKSAAMPTIKPWNGEAGR